MIYLVIYQFVPPNAQKTIELGVELQSSALWLHHIDNMWFIDTNEDIVTLNNRLRKHTQVSDRILIVGLNQWNMYQGWMPPEVWAWLANRVRANNPVQPSLLTMGKDFP